MIIYRLSSGEEIEVPEEVAAILAQAEYRKVYRRVHSRLTGKRGRADAHACSICTETRAKQWAHLWKESDDITDLDAYVPMCGPCHRMYDKELFVRNANNNWEAHRKRVRNTGWRPCSITCVFSCHKLG